jgi:photosystem II stability/assembly factor-like uncharacterized protein
MHGDFSLDLTLRAQRYSSVRFQQGRVLTDSDWNEQIEIVNLRTQRQAEDVIGQCGAPMDASGFRVRATTTALAIAAASSDEACVVGEDGAIFLLTSGSPDAVALRATLPSEVNSVHLRAVHFPAANQGYIVGDRGTLLSITLGSPGPLIARLALADVAVDLRGVHFISPTQGYAVGEGGMLLFITTSGTGATAKQIEVPVTGCLHAVHFVDATDGFAVGDDGAVLAITSGSPEPVATKIDIPAGLATDLYDVHALNRDQAYAVGKEGTILFIDRNASPKAVKLTAAGVTEHLRAVHFVSSSQGYTVGDRATIVSIDAGGLTPILTKVPPPAGLDTDADLRGIAFPMPTTGYAVGENGTVLRLEGLVPILLPELPAVSLKLAAGRFYSHGALCDLDEEATYLNQPYFANPPSLDPGTHLLYLDAWERHVTHVEDPEILEVALGGPDTTTRTQTIAQVKALKLDALSPPEALNCLSKITEWDALTTPRHARLRARARPEELASNVCDLPARAGFRRLENQLYRVEIHTADPAAATFTFKWSRENGSVTYPITQIAEDPAKSQTVVAVSQRGRDPNLDLAPENWVEIVDDDLVLANRPGRLLEYEKDGNDPLEIVLKGLLGAGFTAARDPNRHPLLRRWDHRAPSGGEGALPLEVGKWLDLEDGVQVYFEPGGDYRPGDYWLIPARSLKADVIWPVDECGGPEALLPRGIHHAYCRLALVEIAPDAGVRVLSDCRPEFPALTELTQIYYVSGDGQDGAPGAVLPKPLQVRVANGQHPVAGARVRFEVEGPDSGTLDGSPPVGALIVQTDAEGLAQCHWQLALYRANPDNRSQRVVASLLDASESPVAGQVVRFNATASMALEYVSGDGQDGSPGVLLPRPLVVRVANGQHPVVGVRVRFEVEGSDSGSLGASPEGPVLVVSTDARGLADCEWQLAPYKRNADNRSQRVTATLLDASGNLLAGQVVLFNATATLFLQYVSGDGQEARPGQPLARPLEVRVINGQYPVADARVRFTVAGGGTLSTTLVTTGSNGMATTNWTLGPGTVSPDERQRVVAELIDGTGSVVQSLAFNATLSVASEVAYMPGACDYLKDKTTVQEVLDALCLKPDLGGHCVTIGTGWEVDRLTKDALEKKLAQWKGHVCLCFMPGQEHPVDGFEIDGTGHNYRLSIKGCGHGPMVTLKTRPLTLKAFASVELADFSLNCAGTTGLGFLQCGKVRIAGMEVTGESVASVPLVGFEKIKSAELYNCEIRATRAAVVVLDFSECDKVRIAGTAMTGNVANRLPLLRFTRNQSIDVYSCEIGAISADRTGTAVVFEDGGASVRFNQNRIVGAVSFYGMPGRPGDLEAFVRTLATLMPKIRFVPSNGALFADQNHFDWLTIGDDKLNELRSPNAPIGGVLGTVKLAENVFRAGGNIVLGLHTTINASLFLKGLQIVPGGDVTLGTAIGFSAWGIGNDSPDTNISGDQPPTGPILNLLSIRTMGPTMLNHTRFGNMVRVVIM